MRVLFVARHNQANSNDDEGAITHALLRLGHEVHALPEDYATAAPVTGYDLCLFLKWRNPEAFRRIKFPKAFWYFDRVGADDPSLAARGAARAAWMRETVPLVDVGFLTDGDHVAADASGKLVWLPQGADERVVGRGVGEPQYDVLFTGIGKGGGRDRVSFVEEMRARYGERFRHVERGVHGRALADLVARSRIVVAPDAPATDRYWSNRVYVTLGFGGFLLHPWCEGLTRQYEQYEEVAYYRSREELHEMISTYLRVPSTRAEISEAGLERTLSANLYRHRVETLLRVCRERGLVS
jgi:hypothetical protein